jgi:uncharacterized protein YbjT (DUF2867 family)
MKILLTGATGYIGKRLLPILVQQGHTLVCCTRDKDRFNPPRSLAKYLEVIEVDFLERASLDKIPKDIDGAYYLMHSMSSSSDYQELEQKSAQNFREVVSQTQVKHVVYLSGMVNDEELSPHLSSRLTVEQELAKGSYPLTTLRAGIIIGSGSASFEIIRDLVEKLPVMVAPKWLKTRCQPIGIRDVISFLEKTLFCEATYDKNFDIAGPDVLSYKEMLMGFARVRGLKRWIGTVPVMTPKLSSYWLYFITSTSYPLAQALVDSMKVEVVSRKDDIHHLLGIEPAGYEKALRRTFSAIEANQIISSWKDSFVSGVIDIDISDFLQVPTFGCFQDKRSKRLDNPEKTLQNIWKIGGQTGWYYGNWLWKIRGLMDKMAGGVGLRRGRTHPYEISPGDAIDFWRVLFADKKEGRLLLFAEMKLPGEAWLEFKKEGDRLVQTATFRPRGIAGRLYWYAVLPFHGFIFQGMLNRVAV